LSPAQKAYGPAGNRATAPTRTPTRSGRTPAGGGGGGTRDVPAPSAPQASAPRAPRAPLNWRDSAYNSQIASIQRALQDFETGAQQRGDRFGIDFNTSLDRMGYRPGSGFTAMPNLIDGMDEQENAQMASSSMARSSMSADDSQEEQPLVQPISGAFDIEGVSNPFTTAARGTRSLRDDFAGRGTLRSSDFARNFGEFQNRLNQQLESMETSRGRFAEDLATDVAQQRTSSQEAQQRAQRDAMMRAAMAAAGGGGF